MSTDLQPFIGANPAIAEVESYMREVEQAECPVTHRFTNGMYIRQIFMPAGTLVASKVHKTQHPYTILQGVVSVYIDGVGVERLEAGHMGITEPGTHRLLYIHEDTVWVTFHPNPDNITDLKILEDLIIEPHEIPELCPGSPPLSQ